MKSRFMLYLLVCACFAGVLLLNWYCLPLHDELAYAFGGQVTPMTGAVTRISSFSDLITQQMNDYLYGRHGRVPLHTIVALFSMTGSFHLFDVVNTLVWMSFVLVLMRFARISLTLRNYLEVFLFAFAFLWYAQSCSFDSAFAVNYLWMAPVTLLMLMLWRRLDDLSTARQVAASFLFLLFGWTQEAFVLPFLAAAGGDLVFRRPRRFGRPLSFVALLAGAAILVLGPSSRARAGGVFSDGLLSAALAILGTIPRAALYVAPPLLALALVLIACRRLRRLSQFVELEVLYLFASVALCLAVPTDFSPRLMMPAGTIAFVLVLRHRADLPNCLRSSFFRMLSLAAIALWFALSVGMQVLSGRDNERMISVYSQPGEVRMPRHYVPIIGYTADRGQFTRWHLRLIQLYTGKDEREVGRLVAVFPRESCKVAAALKARLPAFIYVRLQYLLPDPDALETSI